MQFLKNVEIIAFLKLTPFFLFKLRAMKVQLDEGGRRILLSDKGPATQPGSAASDCGLCPLRNVTF